MSLPLTFFILASVLVTSLLSGILGMAGGMVLMGLLVWVLPVQQSMMLHATSQFFANGSRAFIHRSHLHMKSLKYYLAGIAVSFLVFCIVTYLPDKVTVFTLLGVGPFVPLLVRKRFKFDFTRPWQAFVCGIVVTCFQLTGGVSGPMLDIFFQKIDMTRHQVLATKAFTQAISHTVKFIYFGFIIPRAGEADMSLPYWIYLAVIPVAVFGSHSAKYLLNKMTDVQFYKATQLMLWAIGVVYLCKAALLAFGGA